MYFWLQFLFFNFSLVMFFVEFYVVEFVMQLKN